MSKLIEKAVVQRVEQEEGIEYHVLRVIERAIPDGIRQTVVETVHITDVRAEADFIANQYNTELTHA